MKNKFLKICSVVAVFLVLLTINVLPFINCFAADYDSYLGYWQLNETITLPASTTDEVISGFQFVFNPQGIGDYVVNTITITAGDGNRTIHYSNSNYANDGGFNWYGQLRNTWYASRVINVVTVNGALASFLDSYATKLSSNYSPDFNSGYDEGYTFGYNVGYEEAYNFAYNEGLREGAQAGYTSGFEAGQNASASESLGQNLLGSTLAAPMNALNGFVLFEFEGINGPQDITLGEVVGGCVALVVFIAFLKIFAGG